MAIRKRGTGWQVRVKPFPDRTLPTRAAAERHERALKERKALGELWVERPRTFGEELDARLERKKAMGGRRGKLRPKTVAFYEQSAAPYVADGVEPDDLGVDIRSELVERAAAISPSTTPQSALARRFNVSQPTISQILRSSPGYEPLTSPAERGRRRARLAS